MTLLSDIPIVVPPSRTLYPFQIEGVKKCLHFLTKNPTHSVYNASDPGCGKSPMTLACINSICPVDGGLSTLIICPSIMKLVWVEQIKKWSTQENYFIKVIESGKKERIIEVGDPRRLKNYASTFTIVSYGLAATSRVHESLMKGSYMFLVNDESHALKTRKALRTQKVLGTDKVPGLWSRATYRICLSGTPFTKDVIDGFTLFSKMHPDAFPTWYHFVTTYCNQRRTPWAVEYYGVKNPKLLSKLIRNSFYVRYKKDEVLKDLPKKIWQVVPLDKTYAYDSISINKEAVEAALKSLERDGALSINVLGGERKAQGLLRLDPTIQFIEAKMEEGKPIVVFAYHTEFIERLALALKAYAPEVITGATPPAKREEIRQRFQDGTTKLLIANLIAAGEGIDLTVSDTCIFAEITYSPKDLSQAVSRLHRIGNKAESINIFYFIVEDSIEEDIIKAVMDKAKVFSSVLDK